MLKMNAAYSAWSEEKARVSRKLNRIRSCVLYETCENSRLCAADLGKGLLLRDGEPGKWFAPRNVNARERGKYSELVKKRKESRLWK